MNSEPGFREGELPADEDLYRCVHCGLCLSACPTYVELSLEPESPRGRIALMKAVKEGRLGISDRVASHWEMCLQCRACEAVCPSGVPFGRLMEVTRDQVRRQRKGSWRLRLVGALFLRGRPPPSIQAEAGRRPPSSVPAMGLPVVGKAVPGAEAAPGWHCRAGGGTPRGLQPLFRPYLSGTPRSGRQKATVVSCRAA